MITLMGGGTAGARLGDDIDGFTHLVATWGPRLGDKRLITFLSTTSARLGKDEGFTEAVEDLYSKLGPQHLTTVLNNRQVVADLQMRASRTRSFFG